MLLRLLDARPDADHPAALEREQADAAEGAVDVARGRRLVAELAGVRGDIHDPIVVQSSVRLQLTVVGLG